MAKVTVPAVSENPSNLDLLAGIDINSAQTISLPLAPTFPVVGSQTPQQPPPTLTQPTHNPPANQIPVLPQNPVRPNDAHREKVVGVAELRQEAERLEAFVASLTVKTLQGSVLLESLWKDVLGSVDKDGKKLSVSVARCYPTRNRAPDILPYDQSRVQLKNSKVSSLLCTTATIIEMK